jgi:catechol 2,3-dioxygenase-like lactoylglutathione lyase family enzyme
MPLTVEQVDFISIPSRNLARSRAFYLDTLGLPLDRDTPTGFEVKAGQVTLGVAPSSSRPVSPSRARPSTPASAIWRCSAIPTATR